MVNGAAPSTAVPCTRRIPAHTAFTAGSSVGAGSPTVRWASAMAASRRAMVDVLAMLARSAR
jgi:hypothetical protein